MSLFSRFVRPSPLEEELHELYTGLLVMAFGMTEEEAKEGVSQGIAKCKREGKAEETADLPMDFGDRLIEAARVGKLSAKGYVDRIRCEGVTDKDIREWWNQPDLSRRMMGWQDLIARIHCFESIKENEGLSEEVAASRVRKLFPSYGKCDDTGKRPDEDRPLPEELRNRVNAFRSSCETVEEISGFTSFNAFVRDAIRKGLI